jgi:putative hydrolase of the HAD superfamily
MKRAIRAVSFDVGGTLIEPWPSVGHVYAKVAALHGIKNLSPELLNKNFAAAWKVKQNFNHTKADWSALVEKSFAGLANASQCDAFFPDLYERFAQTGAWTVFDDVFPTLEMLSQRGLRLAVVSNWDERLRILLPALGLDRFFKTIVVSCEVGAPKPSFEIFNAAARQLEIAANEVLHVGDSFEEDVTGAEAAGFNAIWICRKAPPAGNSISSLDQLLRFL